ncbi:hypothetical protein C8J57DRAFT_1303783 [Mycena rebaudengoi]|nr:hypothetical protein C8J57DRAFT_1303783 [Mycena rebaudengoi]
MSIRRQAAKRNIPLLFSTTFAIISAACGFQLFQCFRRSSLNRTSSETKRFMSSCVVLDPITIRFMPLKATVNNSRG